MSKVPAALTLPEIQAAFRDMDKRVAIFDGSQNIDLRGRRIINAGNSQDGGDYATLQDIGAAVSGKGGSSQFIAAAFTGTHAARSGTGASPEGALFYETDRHTLYIASGAQWVWIAGLFTVADVTDVPADLAASDDGFLVHIDKFNHSLRWLGNFLKWTWAQGEDGSGFIRDFLVAPDTGGGFWWQLCDGSTVDWLHVDSSLATGYEVLSITVPDEQGNATYHEAGNPDLAVHAAVAPGASATDTPFNAGGGGTPVAQHNSQIITVDASGRPPTVIVFRYFRT